MTVLYAISIDSGTPEQNAAIRNEMEQALGCQDDPMMILIAEEEGEFDTELATRMLKSVHQCK